MSMEQIKLRLIEKEFAVCKIPSLSDVDFDGDFIFLAKTDDELSLVCDEERVPPCALECERGFIALKILGTLDFGLIGIISGITGVLAENGICVFVVSTYNTDYVLIKSENAKAAINELKRAGYHIERGNI